MEKRWITIRVNWPLSWECWAIQSLFETTFAHKARTRSTHKFLQWQHFILILFDWQIRNLVYLWSDRSSTTPSWMRLRYNTWRTQHALQFLSAEHSFSACLIIKSLLSCYIQVFANGVCIQCHGVQLVEQYISGHLRDAAQVKHAWSISSAVSTPPVLALKSSLERQVVLIMSPINLLEVNPLLLKLHKENTGRRTLRTLPFWEKFRYPHVDELQWSWIPKYGYRFIWSHISWNTSLAPSTSAGMNLFVPGLALIIFILLHVHFIAKNNVAKRHHFY